MPLKLTVRDREKLLYEGQCESVTSYNDVGEFDILENHANFISLISKSVVIDKNESGKQKIKIGRGVLSVKNDVVEIYVQEYE